MSQIQEFDADELLYLGAHAAQAGDHERALQRLKQALVLEPDSSRTHHMIGTVYTSIGMHARAERALERALQLDPGMHLARFQLGMMLLTLGEKERAEVSWAPLEQLGEEHALSMFKRGLLALVDDGFADARNLLVRGMHANRDHPALNRDMANVLGRIDALLESQADKESPVERRGELDQSHVLMSAYQGEKH